MKNNNLIYLNKILFTLTTLMPVALVFGRFVSDLFVSLSALFITIILFKIKDYRYFLNPFWIIFFIWCIFIIFSSLISVDPLLSLESSLFYLRFGLFSIAVIYAIKNYKKWFIDFFNFFLISYSICIFFCIIEIVFSFNITIYLFTGYNAEVQNAVYNNPRITGIFGPDVMLGSFISRTLPIFIGILILNYKILKDKYIKFYALIIIPFLFYLVLMSYERSAILYSLFFIFFFGLFNYDYKKLGIIALSSALLIFISSLYFSKFFFNRFITTTFFQSNFDNKFMIGIPIEYQQYFVTAYSIFKNNIIFGAGTKLYRIECQNYISSYDPCNTHPHNIYLQLLAEVGIFGFLGVFTILFLLSFIFLKRVIFILFNKKKIYSDYKFCIIIACIIALFPFLPTGNFFNNYTSAILFLNLALFISFFDILKINR